LTENSRSFLPKTQEIGNLGGILAKFDPKSPKNSKNWSKLKVFPKTQYPKSQKTQEIGNSDDPMMPEKRLKKIPELVIPKTIKRVI